MFLKLCRRVLRMVILTRFLRIIISFFVNVGHSYFIIQFYHVQLRFLLIQLTMEDHQPEVIRIHVASFYYKFV